MPKDFSQNRLAMRNFGMLISRYRSGRVRSARCSGGVEKGHVRDRRRRCRNRDAVARFEARRLVRICYVLESYVSILLYTTDTSSDRNIESKMSATGDVSWEYLHSASPASLAWCEFVLVTGNIS